MQSVDLDEIDRKILQELQEHGRIPNVELADRVGLSPAPCLRRVRALEAAGVIRQYVALVDPQAVDLGVTVFVQVTLNLQVEGRLDTFEEAIRQRPEVLDCYMMAGESDYLLRVVVPVLPLFPSAPRARSSRTPLVAVARRRFGTSKR